MVRGSELLMKSVLRRFWYCSTWHSLLRQSLSYRRFDWELKATVSSFELLSHNLRQLTLRSMHLFQVSICLRKCTFSSPLQKWKNRWWKRSKRKRPRVAVTSVCKQQLQVSLRNLKWLSLLSFNCQIQMESLQELTLNRSLSFLPIYTKSAVVEKRFLEPESINSGSTCHLWCSLLLI